MVWDSKSAAIAGAKSSRRGISHKQTDPLVAAVTKVCIREGFKDGIPEVMTQVAMGKNPFPENPTLERLREFNAQLKKDPAKALDKWPKVLEFAEKHLEHNPVQLSTALEAQKTILEYVYPKKRSVEVKAELAVTAGVMRAAPRSDEDDWEQQVKGEPIDITPTTE